MEEEIKYPRFINIQPCGKDQYDGKSQERTAESISKFIISNKDKNKLIGIDGDWGSGKSNLIKIIEKQYLENYHFFIYDAWSHQEDLQRRSFLEDLTKEISTCENPILDNEIWSARLKDLLAKKKEINTKTIPKLSKGFLALIFIFVFTPVFSSLSESFTCIIDKILISLVPIFLVGIYCFCRWVKIKCRKRKLIKSGCKKIITKKSKFKLDSFLSNLVYIYKDKELENEIHETISENEPSISEFRDWLKKLDDELEINEKKLIIVYDNMDRLPTNKVLQLWSSIHTFFSSDKALNNIWVIVPFDRKHIRLAFDTEIQIEDKSNSDDKKKEPIIKSDKKADHLINKTFTVVYRVPPPILTDWKDFFKLKYREAFGNNEDSELSSTENVYDYISVDFTPRAIISFINELVSLKLIWGNDIKMSYLAVFVLNKEMILENPVDRILDESFLGKAESLFKNDTEIAGWISAIIYNVDKEKAIQIPFTNSIKTYIRDENTEKISDIYRNPYFLDILKRVIDREILNIDSIATTLDVIDYSYYESIPDANDKVISIWNNICTKYITIPLQVQEFTVTQKILLKRTKNYKRELSIHIISGISNAKEFSGSNFYNYLKAVNDYILENKLGIDIPSLVVKKEVVADIFVDYMLVAQSDYKTYKLYCKVDELNEHLSGLVPEELENINFLSHIKNDYDFTVFIESLKSAIINTETPLTIDNFSSVFTVFKDVIVAKPLPVLLTDPEILELFTDLDSDSPGFYDLIAMRLIKGESFKDPNELFDENLDDPDDDTNNNIAQLVEYYKNYSDLALISIEFNRPLLINVLKIITDKLDGSSNLKLSDIITDFDNICETLSITPEYYIEKLNFYISQANTCITSNSLVDSIQFYEGCLKIDNELSKLSISKANEYIDTVTEDIWLATLKDNESLLFRLISLFFKENIVADVPLTLKSAYVKWLKELVTTSKIPDKDDPEWNAIFSKLNNPDITAPIKDILDLFFKDTPSITAVLFQFFAPLFEEFGDLDENPKLFVRKILAPLIDDPSCSPYILSKYQFYVPLIKKAKADSTVLIDSLILQYKENPAKENLKSCLDDLGVKIPEPESDVEENKE